MAYVKFYRGNEANLPAPGAQGLVEGAFYLTTDTWRLYNVIDDNGVLTPHPLGEKINIVQNPSQLTDAVDHIGEFAYIAEGNIFAVSIPDATTQSGAKWKQINAQAQSTELGTPSFTASAANDVATVTWAATTANNHEKTDSFTISAGAGIDVTASGKNVTITKEATPITLTSATDNSKVVGVLNVDGESVQIKGGNNITLTTDTTNGVLTINGQPGGVKSVAVDAQSTGFQVAVTGNDNVEKSDTIDPVVTLGDNASTSYHFVNGTMNLPVYTKNEIDNSLTGLNAMVYQGTIGNAASGATTTSLPAASATTGPQIGDTYKVVSDITDVPVGGGNTKTAHAGDLIIARGTEGTSGKIESNLVWDIVRGADDVDSTYAFVPITNGTSLQENGRVEKGSLTIAAGNKMTVTDNAVGSDNTVTVGHATVAAPTAGTPDTAVTQTNGNSATYTAISGVTTDGYGHITGYTTKQLSVVDTRIKDNGVADDTTVSLDNKTVTVQHGTTITENNNRELNDTSSFTMTSAGSTINMSVTGTNVNYDIVWGTF